MSKYYDWAESSDEENIIKQTNKHTFSYSFSLFSFYTIVQNLLSDLRRWIRDEPKKKVDKNQSATFISISI